MLQLNCFKNSILTLNKYLWFISESITNAKKGDFADDPKLKCYIKCVFDELGMVSDNNIYIIYESWFRKYGIVLFSI